LIGAMILLRRLALLFAVVLLVGGGTPQGGRVALVIGNGSYADAGVLANPVNDAQDIAAKLRTMGFIVVDGYDLGKRDLEGKIGDFADALDGAASGLFYYAGHGIQVDGRNYILPVDAKLNQPAKLKLEAIPIEDVMDLMQQQAGTSILILDACRNNPFARALTAKSTTRSVQAAEGLAQIDGAKGTFIAFSTAPGAVAMDGSGRNSPFAEALLKHIDRPGQSINDLMIAVRRDVVETTKDFQTPMSWDSLTDRFSFVEGEAAADAQPAEQQVAAVEDDEAVATRDIEAFITGKYLKPDAANFVTATTQLFTEDVTSYGRPYKRDELVAIKAQWFAKWEKWKLNLLPGTLKVALFDSETATVTFDMRYRYSPKDKTTGPIAGTVHVTLDMVKEEGQWRIEMENSRVDGQ
jgi:uncharacterized caspase-like protein